MLNYWLNIEYASKKKRKEKESKLELSNRICTGQNFALQVNTLGN